MEDGILVRDPGNVMLFREIQSLKTLPILSLKATPSGSSMSSRALAPLKVAFPEMTLRLEGRTISLSSLQPLTMEPALISSTPSLKTSFLRLAEF